MATKYVYNERYGTTHRSEDGVNINHDGKVYADYTMWIAEPNQKMDITDRIVPQAVTPVQMRKALSAMGLRASVEAAVKAMGQDTQDVWEYSEQVQRNHPLVIAMAAQFGVDLDTLFITAATL